MSLYHYTSLHTLCSIINGTQNGNIFLRASSAKNMNDPNDCYYFVNIIGQLTGADKTQIDKFLEQKNEYDAPYLICLSKLKDDLHMWNCYGDDGKGVAIGFDESKLKRAIDVFYENNNIFARLHKCLYKNTNQVQKMIGLIHNVNINGSFWQKNDISDISNIIKHPCYKYEREYRIIIKRGKKEITINNIYNVVDDVFYLAIPIDAVTNIIVGPNANYNAIKKIFHEYFPKAKLVESKIPYRNK